MSDKQCFVIAPIGDADSETRKRSDKILKYVINPAVDSCGYKPIRADQISEPGMITSQVIQHIVDDPLVIADLTDRNPNVFYELAIRHMLRKPLVQLIKKGDQIPFDVAGTRTIHVDHRDLDSVEEAKKEIIAQVKSLEANASQVETPISVSLDLQSLRQSENPEQRSLADVLSVIAELRTTVAGLEKRLDNPETILPPPYVRQVLRRYGRDRDVSRQAAMELHEMLDHIRIMAKQIRDGDLKQEEAMIDRLDFLEHRFRRLIHEFDIG